MRLARASERPAGASADPAGHPAVADEARRRWTLVAMCAITGLVLFDESGVAVALTDIRDGFGLSATQAYWVVSAYLLVLSTTVAACGRIADMVGQKRMAIGGCLLFGSMSALAGLAPSYEWLMAARLLQGLGAGAAYPTSTGIVRITTPPERLGGAFGYLGVASAIGLAGGPVLGGLLTEWFSWRAVFLAGVPVAVFVAAVTAVTVDRSGRDIGQRAGFDFGGLVLLVAAIGAGVAALMQGPAWGWTSPISLALFGTAAAAGIAFLSLERRRETPLIELDLFRVPSFRTGNLLTFLAQFAKTPVVVYGPLLLIDVLGLSPARAGVGLLPGILAVMLASPVAGRAVDRLGIRGPLLVALLLVGGGLGYLSFAVGLRDYPWLVPGLVAWGLGNTTVFVCSRRAVQDAVPPAKAGQASGVNSTAQWLGAALSVPVLGAFVTSAPERFGALYLAATLVVAVAAAFVLAGGVVSRGRAAPRRHEWNSSYARTRRSPTAGRARDA